jgi:L,D-transpeptidase catalytic domain
MRRFIYIHGSPDSVEMGVPGSIGCIRIRNADIVKVFDLVPVYTPVHIPPIGVPRSGFCAAESSGLRLSANFPTACHIPTQTGQYLFVRRARIVYSGAKLYCEEVTYGIKRA